MRPVGQAGRGEHDGAGAALRGVGARPRPRHGPHRGPGRDTGAAAAGDAGHQVSTVSHTVTHIYMRGVIDCLTHWRRQRPSADGETKDIHKIKGNVDLHFMRYALIELTS